jgi:16S rRNA G527 N7-methylase RsmG
MTLVEPRTKRVAFLRTVVGQVNAGPIPVLRKRSDELGTKVFDAVVSRAVLAPQPWLEHGASLARRDVWILVAQADAPVLDGYTRDVDVAYEWPLTRVSRRILRYRAA